MSHARTAAVASLAALSLGVTVMVALHLVPPTNAISPVRRTLSEYQLSPAKWAFDLSVLLIALGSALAFYGLVRHRVARPLSGAVIFGSLWVVGLLATVLFTKTDWSVGPSTSGMIHRYASVVAFVSLPLAVFLLAKGLFGHRTGWRLGAQGLGALSLAFFGVIIVGVVRMAAGGGPWWLWVPLGLVERAITVTAVGAIVVVVLGVLLPGRRSAEPAAA